MKKICLACSMGGHLAQILQLRKLYEDFDYFFLTENTPLAAGLKEKEKVYLVPLVNRRQLSFPFRLVYNLVYVFTVLLREKPDVVISTGALSTVPCCLIAKLMRKKLIYIESFAKINTPSATGKLVYKFADLFIIQWKQLSEYYPKAVYGGSIY